MREDRLSINLMHLNEERIKYKYIADRKNKLKCKFDNLVLLFKYMLQGDFSYVTFRIKDKLSKKDKCIYDVKNEPRTIDDNDRVAVFTVLFGNYDTLNDPMFISDNCDYYIFTNQDTVKSDVWKKYDVQEDILEGFSKFSDLEKARFCKTHPHLFFADYKYSLFVDANLQIVADVRPVVAQLSNNFIAIHKQPGRSCVYQEATEIIVRKKANKKQVKNQVNSYRKEGFPKNFGMFQTNVVAREHNKPECIDLMNVWWGEMEKFTKRDQLSFTYSLWKNNLTAKNVSVLGENTDLNPRFKISSHL